MILRDVMVWQGIIDSARVCAMSVAGQLFFRNLLHVCDGAGRFENDAELMRTKLYGRSLHRVSKRDIARWLEECRAADLIRLYTVRERGYGAIPNYRQKDTLRKVRYPSPNGEEELPLTADVDPPPKRKNKLNRREVSVAGAPAQDTHHTISDEEWLQKMADLWPGIDVRAELKKSEKRYPLGIGRKFFEEQWLPKAEPRLYYKPKAQTTPMLAAPAIDEAAVEAERAQWRAMDEPSAGTLAHAMWLEAVRE